MTVMRKNSILYKMNVLISSMAVSIIFSIAGTRRVLPVEIFLSSDVATVMQCVLFLVHLPFVLPRFVGVVFAAC